MRCATPTESAGTSPAANLRVMSDYSYDIALFQKTGVELEYMVVDADTLDVRPIADQLFEQVAGEPVSDIEPDDPETGIGWSNELALHVVELKTPRPVPSLDPLPQRFQEHIRKVNALLADMNARLLPTGMHPWMDPHREMRLWPHEYNEIYQTFDRIFSCQGHGWANLQSTHINLPFANDDEFGRLHAAIRLVLPILPALAASTPVMDGKLTGLADSRLEVYRHNARKVPQVAAKVVPEPVWTRKAYEDELLGGIYDVMRPMDPEGVLRHEWVNARGCIARFNRGSIEIRLLDLQECPAADLAVVRLVHDVVQAMTEERWIDAEAQRAYAVDSLHEVLVRCIRDGERAVIEDAAFLRAFGMRDGTVAAGELWGQLQETLRPDDVVARRLLKAGSLSSRIMAALPADPDRDALWTIYRELADCLRDGELFRA